MSQRYTLELPDETYKKLKEIANDEETTVANLLRKATQLLMYIRTIRDDPGASLLIERGGKTQELVIDLI